MWSVDRSKEEDFWSFFNDFIMRIKILIFDRLWCSHFSVMMNKNCKQTDQNTLLSNFNYKTIALSSLSFVFNFHRVGTDLFILINCSCHFSSSTCREIINYVFWIVAYCQSGKRHVGFCWCCCVAFNFPLHLLESLSKQHCHFQTDTEADTTVSMNTTESIWHYTFFQFSFKTAQEIKLSNPHHWFMVHSLVSWVFKG